MTGNIKPTRTFLVIRAHLGTFLTRVQHNNNNRFSFRNMNIKSCGFSNMTLMGLLQLSGFDLRCSELAQE